jgi:hypothetical protein
MRIGRRDVSLTNLEKVYFPAPGLTKGDLVSYYLDLAPYALNHVERRPMQMKRYPNGVEGEFFYQKRVPDQHPDWLETVHVPSGGAGARPTFRSSPMRPASPGSSTSAASSSTRGTPARPTSSAPTTCSSISTRVKAIRGSSSPRSRWWSRR